MYCSNCGMEVKGNFCSNCGAKIEAQTKNDQPVENVEKAKVTEKKENKPNILVRSKSCIDLVEERKKATDKWLNQSVMSISIICILAIFGPQILALLQGKNLSRVDSMPLPVILMMMGILIFGSAAFGKTAKKFNVVYNQYKQYCATEVLIVDDTRIYGSTSKGELTLSYNQIESVSFAPVVYDPQDKTPVIPNDIFKVYDIAGNEFTFYSFKNCKELKVVIDTKLKEN